MHSPKPLKFQNFHPEQNFFPRINDSFQGKYLVNYLNELKTQQVIIEPNYFDRDYLAEFSAFYSLSSYGYENICKRVHFFSNTNIKRELFIEATGEDSKAISILNNSYLGFCVIRPIKAQLGKTVLKCLANKEEESKRIIIQRDYKCHIAGVDLNIKGLAWQQQDRGVGACATVALWSALQSSAFDDFHSVPTTVDITKSAHKTASFGSKVFPSEGLTDFQLYEAIKELGLSPMIQSGYITQNNAKFFQKDHFISFVSSYIRSDYPIILLGTLQKNNQDIGKHAICITGFRENRGQATPDDKPLILMDSDNEIIYAHDDNIGPNARFKIKALNNTDIPVLHLEPPSYSKFKEESYQIIPETLVIATHNDIKASPDQLHKTGLYTMRLLHLIFQIENVPISQLSLGTRFIKLTNYIHEELQRLLKNNPKILSQLRLNLYEKTRPMSLYLGLVRIAIPGSHILMDVLYDTTDSHLQPFAYIPYGGVGLKNIIEKSKFDFGYCIEF